MEYGATPRHAIDSKVFDLLLSPKSSNSPPRDQPDATASAASSSLFPDTRWTLVLDAQNDGDEALANLCKDYWRPLYTFALRRCRNVSDAEDLTQGFFEDLLSRDALSHARESRGKLRNFLLKSMQYYAATQYKAQNRIKRGGGKIHVVIDADEAEQLAAEGFRNEVTPEIEFDRTWARQLLSHVFDKLSVAYSEAGKSQLFDALKPQVVPGLEQQPYLEIAAELGTTEPSVRLAAFKLRSRYRKLLRETIRETVCTDAEIDEELAHMKSVFGS